MAPPIPDIKEIVQIGMYTVRAPAASGRLVLDDEPQLRYYAKGTQPERDIGALFEPESRTFDYLDWIARLTSHIPDRGCQMTHYNVTSLFMWSRARGQAWIQSLGLNFST